ncbi:MAG: choice-of-anchor D domain-containing protein, partial [Candidatus Coatesbacteria bacterium]|nr:choice-of-anchor D domain-containing protein [Candidatus Coatesbacteria bacterium]
ASPIAVAFTASDALSGVAEVALWFNYNGGAWTDSGLTENGTSGSFDFAPANGEGTYEFYTIAQDYTGNVEAAPATADDSTVYDTIAPQSTCTSAQFANASPIAVAFTASDALSGIAEVALWFNHNGGAWTDSGLTENGASGSFDFAPADGDGTYEFYTIAADDAGNDEAAPGAADDSTIYDTLAPQSTASSPESVTSAPFSVGFTASDAVSGVAQTRLWYRFNEGAWQSWGEAQAGASGSFSFDAPDGQGTFDFYTIAVDNAGNIETVPSAADCTTVYSVPGAKIWVSADSIDFGEVNVGEEGSRTLAVRNDGDSDLWVTNISVGSGSFDFQSSLPLPITLGPGDGFDLEVMFLPPEEGTFEDVLSIESNDPDAPVYDVALAGEGVAVAGLTVNVFPNADTFVFDQTFEINVSVENTGGPVSVDVYMVLTYDFGGPEERNWSASLTAAAWTEGLAPLVTAFEVPEGFDFAMQWWTSVLPAEYPRISKSGSYTLRMAAVEPGTLNLVSNYDFDGFTLAGEPFIDVSTNAETYSLTADSISMSLDIALPSYQLIGDFYLVLFGPGGEFWCPTGFGADVVWMTGIFPLLTYFETPPDIKLELEAVVMNLPSGAPFDAPGQFVLFTGFVEPGTLTPYSDIGTTTFTLL